MIEQKILAYLEKTFDLPVVMERPEKPPTKFILIQKTGGSVQNHLRSSRFAVQSYAGSLHDAAKLNSEIIKKMDGLTSVKGISKAAYNSDYFFPDLVFTNYRYQCVFDIYYME